MPRPSTTTRITLGRWPSPSRRSERLSGAGGQLQWHKQPNIQTVARADHSHQPGVVWTVGAAPGSRPRSGSTFTQDGLFVRVGASVALLDELVAKPAHAAELLVAGLEQGIGIELRQLVEL